MPEIKNNFSSGKMNKDLDERLIPPSEYRDALNLDIVTSEGSDVGAFENTYGNIAKSELATYYPQETFKCIGSFINQKDHKIVWFVSGLAVDFVIEFNPETNIVSPILVDTNKTTAPLQDYVNTLTSNYPSGWGNGSFLRFDPDNLITGINIVDGMLFWTDNNTEPKKINIERCKQGADEVNPWTTTTYLIVDGNNVLKPDTNPASILEKHITLIKKYPFNAPEIELSQTLTDIAVSIGVQASNVETIANTSYIHQYLGMQDSLGQGATPTYWRKNWLTHLSGDFEMNNQVFTRTTKKGIDTTNSVEAATVSSGIISNDKQYRRIYFDRDDGTYSTTNGNGMESDDLDTENKYKKWRTIRRGMYVFKDADVVGKIHAIDYFNHIITLDYPYTVKNAYADAATPVVGTPTAIPVDTELSFSYRPFNESDDSWNNDVYNNESFWTYKDSNGTVKIKPPGTGNTPSTDPLGNMLLDGGKLAGDSSGNTGEVDPTVQLLDGYSSLTTYHAATSGWDVDYGIENALITDTAVTGLDVVKSVVDNYATVNDDNVTSGHIYKLKAKITVKAGYGEVGFMQHGGVPINAKVVLEAPSTTNPNQFPGTNFGTDGYIKQINVDFISDGNEIQIYKNFTDVTTIPTTLQDANGNPIIVFPTDHVKIEDISISCLSGPRPVIIQPLTFSPPTSYNIGDEITLSSKTQTSAGLTPAIKVKLIEEDLDFSMSGGDKASINQGATNIYPTNEHQTPSTTDFSNATGFGNATVNSSDLTFNGASGAVGYEGGKTNSYVRLGNFDFDANDYYRINIILSAYTNGGLRVFIGDPDNWDGIYLSQPKPVSYQNLSTAGSGHRVYLQVPTKVGLSGTQSYPIYIDGAVAGDNPNLVISTVSVKRMGGGVLPSSSYTYDYGGTGTNGNRSVWRTEITHIDDDVKDLIDVSLNTGGTGLTWSTSFIETKKDPLYEFSFPRFAYRWKYEDGEYSAISPFSEIGFLPDSTIGYKYDSEEGYNLSMTNTARKITLSKFDKLPQGAIELDLLYKESNSTNIYTIKTFRGPDLEDLSDTSQGTYSITKEHVHAVVAENQLLRPYDNVPRKAQAQEITANRLMYGNYLQQYNMDPDVNVKVVNSPSLSNLGIPKKSIKSIRNYQVGVCYLDNYGRQTPVFSDLTAIIDLSQSDAVNRNNFRASLVTPPPDWASHYKYFVKNNSDEYYNVPLDRFYQSNVAGHAWLAFNSNDVNKFSIDDYLILKKKHSSNKSVPLSAATVKYKVLEKEGEAPEYIKHNIKKIGVTTNGITDNSNTRYNIGLLFPEIGGNSFNVHRPNANTSEWIPDLLDAAFADGVEHEDDYIRITKKDSSGVNHMTSKYYRVKTTEATTAIDENSVNANYRKITVEEAFGEDLNFMPRNTATGVFKQPTTDDNVVVEYFKGETITDELDNKFFVKIKEDIEFSDNVSNSDGSANKWKVKEHSDTHLIHNWDTASGESDVDALDSVFLESITNFVSGDFTSGYDQNISDPSISGTGGAGSTASGSGTSDVLNYDYGRGKDGQWFAIDHALAWPFLNDSYHQDPFNQSNMGRGFIIGRSFCDFRFFNIGSDSGLTNDFNVPVDDYATNSWVQNGYPLSDAFINNFDFYKDLTTVGSRFRWSIDPTNTIYTITGVEIIRVHNYRGGKDPSDYVGAKENQGVRVKLSVSPDIQWSPAIENYDGSANPDLIGWIDNSVDSDWNEEGALNTGSDLFTSSLEIVSPSYPTQKKSSSSPAIFEVEPKKKPDLNLYYETPKSLMVFREGMSIAVLNSDGTIYEPTFNGSTNRVFNVNAVITFEHGSASEPIFGGSNDGDPNPYTSINFYVNSQYHNHFSGTYVDANGVVIPDSFVIPAGKIIRITRKDENGIIEEYQDLVLTSEWATYDPEKLGGPGPTTIQEEIVKDLQFYNCFTFGNGVESDRIRDDYNEAYIDSGPRVSTTLVEPYKEERRASGMIYSGIYNSVSGVNRLNQFIMAESITKDLNPVYGSIQKLFTRNTNVITFCENKTLKILAEKDALYNADGSTNVALSNKVLGSTVPFLGEFGISKNPESFANYGYRIYYTDKNRGAVLRLSGDGITNLAQLGMVDYFKDNLRQATTVIGGYDQNKDLYDVSFNDQTISFSENAKGWTSRKSFIPESSISSKNYYYTFKNGDLYAHDVNVNRNTFYGVSYDSFVEFIFNQDSGLVKNFKTLKYEGTDGWTANEIQTDLQFGKVNNFVDKEGKWFNHIRGLDNTLENLNTKQFTSQGLGFVDGINLNPNDPDGTPLNSTPYPEYYNLNVIPEFPQQFAKWGVSNSSNPNDPFIISQTIEVGSALNAAFTSAVDQITYPTYTFDDSVSSYFKAITSESAGNTSPEGKDYLVSITIDDFNSIKSYAGTTIIPGEIRFMEGVDENGSDIAFTENDYIANTTETKTPFTVLDPSFDGNLAGWTQLDGICTVDGNQLKVDATGFPIAKVGTSSPINLTVGQTYRLEWTAIAGTGNPFAHVYLGDGNHEVNLNTGAFGTVYHDFTVPAGALLGSEGDVNIQFGNAAPNGVSWFDDIKLFVLNPVPGTEMITDGTFDNWECITQGAGTYQPPQGDPGTNWSVSPTSGAIHNCNTGQNYTIQGISDSSCQPVNNAGATLPLPYNYVGPSTTSGVTDCNDMPTIGTGCRLVSTDGQNNPSVNQYILTPGVPYNWSVEILAVDALNTGTLHLYSGTGADITGSYINSVGTHTGTVTNMGNGTIGGLGIFQIKRGTGNAYTDISFTNVSVTEDQTKQNLIIGGETWDNLVDRVDETNTGNASSDDWGYNLWDADTGASVSKQPGGVDFRLEIEQSSLNSDWITVQQEVDVTGVNSVTLRAEVIQTSGTILIGLTDTLATNYDPDAYPNIDYITWTATTGMQEKVINVSAYNTVYVLISDGSAANGYTKIDHVSLWKDVSVPLVPSGSNLITNGSFDSDDWVLTGSGWVIDAGVATHTGSTYGIMTQTLSVPLEEGVKYRLTSTVTGTLGAGEYLVVKDTASYLAGNNNVSIINGEAEWTQGDTNLDKIVIFTNANITIDDIEVEKIDRSEYTKNFTYIHNNTNPFTLKTYGGNNNPVWAKITNISIIEKLGEEANYNFYIHPKMVNGVQWAVSASGFSVDPLTDTDNGVNMQIGTLVDVATPGAYGNYIRVPISLSTTSFPASDVNFDINIEEDNGITVAT